MEPIESPEFLGPQLVDRRGPGIAVAVSKVDLDETVPELAFLHGNAYPPECYRLLLDEFARDYHVRAMALRPLWQQSDAAAHMDSWHILSSDFLKWVDSQYQEPIVAVGHSLGAIVALRAALREPARFRAAVLLDPVLLTRAQILVWRLLRHIPVGHRLHSAVRRAERRRRVFADVDEAFAVYRRHPVFRRIPDHALRVVIEGLFLAANGHLELRYSPTWEARIYATAVWDDLDIWDGLATLGVPALVVRGANSDTLTESACRAALRASDNIALATIDRATHLLPFERPQEVCAVVRPFLEGCLAPHEAGVGQA